MHPHTDAWFLLADKFYTKTFDFVVNVIDNDVKLFPEDYHARERWWKFIGPVILGDPAYPLLPWLLKPCSENPNTILEHRRFNYRLSKARFTVENAFDRWKGRFRRFLKRVDNWTWIIC
jgi:hypothetical protein